ncbi:hypothetical protein D8S78_03305 [Natrialba swarupiae]|nr:hypothetical protein [Natrialba swarupiae]
MTRTTKYSIIFVPRASAGETGPFRNRRLSDLIGGVTGEIEAQKENDGPHENRRDVAEELDRPI